MDINLINKKAFVCGSTQGIGRAAAIELANLGASVVLLARNEDSLKQVKNGLNFPLHTLLPSPFLLRKRSAGLH
jgi:3-oxoacyl-[acyl-carrier protein] reductase